MFEGVECCLKCCACCALIFLLSPVWASIYWMHIYSDSHPQGIPQKLQYKTMDNTFRPLTKNYTMMCFKNGKISYGGVNVGSKLYLENEINKDEADEGVIKPRGDVFNAENKFW